MGVTLLHLGPGVQAVWAQQPCGVDEPHTRDRIRTRLPPVGQRPSAEASPGSSGFASRR
jgi:hypothetical protein